MLTFTVITCTYNAATTVARTLASVAAQDYSSVEHLLIDGASNDGTVALLEDYAAGSRHSVVVDSAPDDGLYYAMNKGLQRATGDYVVFLNAGDTFPSPSTLTAVAAAAASSSPLPGVLFGETNIVDDEGTVLRPRRLAPNANMSWRAFRDGMLICHQAFYALTALAQSIPYDVRYRYSADYDWCIRVMRRAEEEGRQIVAVPQPVAHYLEGGLTRAHHLSSLAERFTIMRRHYGLPRAVAQHLWFALRLLLRP